LSLQRRWDWDAKQPPLYATMPIMTIVSVLLRGNSAARADRLRMIGMSLTPGEEDWEDGVTVFRHRLSRRYLPDFSAGKVTSSGELGMQQEKRR